MEKNHSKTTQLLAILVLAVFGFCVLMLLLASASVYQNLVDAGEAEFHRRTALGYLTTRVRQADSVRIEEFEDQEVLVLEEILEGEMQYDSPLFFHRACRCTGGYFTRIERGH